MFRLFALICLVHCSVGIIIRGRVLLNSDVNQMDRVPIGSQLIVRLEDTSLADAPSILLKETVISNLVSFPINYEFRIPTGIPPALSYTLSARIKKGDIFLYIGAQNIPVSPGAESPITIDIPVTIVRENRAPQPVLNNMKRLSWPELVGRDGTYAVQYIKENTGLTNVRTLPEGSIVTMDFRTDRVRIFVNKDGIVTKTPRTG